MSEKISVNGIMFTEEMILMLTENCRDLEKHNEILRNALVSTLEGGKLQWKIMGCYWWIYEKEWVFNGTIDKTIKHFFFFLISLGVTNDINEYIKANKTWLF